MRPRQPYWKAHRGYYTWLLLGCYHAADGAMACANAGKCLRDAIGTWGWTWGLRSKDGLFVLSVPFFSILMKSMEFDVGCGSAMDPQGLSSRTSDT